MVEQQEYNGMKFKQNRARNIKNGELLKSENTDGKFSFCLVIPFPFEDDLKRARERILATREYNEVGEKWFADEVIIAEKDFIKLVSKSNKIRILLSLDKEEKDEDYG